MFIHPAFILSFSISQINNIDISYLSKSHIEQKLSIVLDETGRCLRNDKRGFISKKQPKPLMRLV